MPSMTTVNRLSVWDYLLQLLTDSRINLVKVNYINQLNDKLKVINNAHAL